MEPVSRKEAYECGRALGRQMELPPSCTPDECRERVVKASTYWFQAKGCEPGAYDQFKRGVNEGFGRTVFPEE